MVTSRGGTSRHPLLPILPICVHHATFTISILRYCPYAYVTSPFTILPICVRHITLYDIAHMRTSHHPLRYCPYAYVTSPFTILPICVSLYFRYCPYAYPFTSDIAHMRTSRHLYHMRTSRHPLQYCPCAYPFTSNSTHMRTDYFAHLWISVQLLWTSRKGWSKYN